MSRRGLHTVCRLTNSNANGEHVLLLRIAFGYWPCLRAPFIQLGIGKYMLDIWYGGPSYVAKTLPKHGGYMQEQK